MKKKLLFTVMLMSFFVLGYAEMHVSTHVENKNVLVEEFTGIQCGYCPQAHAIVADMIEAQGGKVYAIAFHAGGYAIPGSDQPDFRVPEGETINDYWGITGNPAGIINRRAFGDQYITNRSFWATYARQITEEAAPVNLYVASSYDEASRQITIDVEAYYTADVDADFNLLSVAVTESGILGPQKGAAMGDEYVHQHMLRDFVTPVWGDTITDCKQGSFVTRKYVYDVPETINDVAVNPANIELVVFVSENEKNVLNVTGSVPAYAGLVLPMAAEIIEPRIPISSSYGGDYFVVDLNNKSTDEVTSASFELTLNGEKYELEWTGVIAPRTQSEISIPFEFPQTLKETRNRYTLALTALNGETYKGNKLTGQFDAPYAVTPTIKVEFNTDMYADENRFMITDTEGNVAYEFGPYEAGIVTEVSEIVTLEPNTTYRFVITDAWSNAIYDNYYRLYDANGKLIFKGQFYEGHGSHVYFTTAAYNVSTEVKPKHILLEDFTGIYCGNCPDAHAMIDEMLKSRADILHPIAIHAGHYADPQNGHPDFRTPEGDEYDTYFQPDGYPNGMVNRTKFAEGDEYMYNRGVWSDLCRTISEQDAPVNLWIGSVYDSATKKLTVNVEGYYTADVDAEQNMLNVVIAQSNIVAYQNGESANYVHNHVARKYLTPVWGDAITECKQGDSFKRQYVYDVPADINGIAFDPAYIEVLAYVCIDKADVLNVTQCRPHYPDLVLPLKAEIEPYKIGINGTYAYNFYEAYLVNKSTTDITNASFIITLNGVAYDAQWTGLAPARETTYIKIPFNQSSLIEANNDYEIELIAVNGIGSGRSSFKGDFQDPIATTPMNKFIIKTDNNATDNQYLIRDMSGKVVYEFGPYPAGAITEVTEEVELEANTTYCLEITDSWSDGIMNPRGTCKVYNADGKIVAQILEIKDHGCRHFFATTLQSGVEGVAADVAYNVYYNAYTGAIVVAGTQNETYRVAVYNMAGECVYTAQATGETVIPAEYDGVYVVQVTSAAISHVAKVVVNK